LRCSVLSAGRTSVHVRYEEKPRFRPIGVTAVLGTQAETGAPITCLLTVRRIPSLIDLDQRTAAVIMSSIRIRRFSPTTLTQKPMFTAPNGLPNCRLLFRLVGISGFGRKQ